MKCRDSPENIYWSTLRKKIKFSAFSGENLLINFLLTFPLSFLLSLPLFSFWLSFFHSRRDAFVFLVNWWFRFYTHRSRPRLAFSCQRQLLYRHCHDCRCCYAIGERKIHSLSCINRSPVFDLSSHQLWDELSNSVSCLHLSTFPTSPFMSIDS